MTKNLKLKVSLDFLLNTDHWLVRFGLGCTLCKLESLACTVKADLAFEN